MITASWSTRLRETIGIDLRSLALFRLALGSLLCVDTLRRISDLAAFHTDAGMLPRSFLVQDDGGYRVSLMLANGEPWFAGLFLLLTAAVALAFALGWRTRLVSVLLFALIVSVQNRNPMVLIGGDSLITCLLFWSLFLPLGARYSVDAALSTQPPPQQNLHVSPASLGMVLQVLSVYFFSAVLKDGADWWPDGLAVYYTMELERYATPTGRLLLHAPWLMKALSWFVYFLEWLGPILALSPLLLRPLRFAVMLMLMAMHIGFLICMEIGHFPLVSLCSLTLLTGGWVWDRLGQRLRARPVSIYYDHDCGFCRRSCLLLRHFLLLGPAPIRAAQDDPEMGPMLEREFSWIVVNEQHQPQLRWAAFVALVQASPILRPLAPLMRWRPVAAAGDWLYLRVAHNRGAVAAASLWLMPERAVRFGCGWLAQGVAAVFVAAVLVWNLATINLVPLAWADAMKPVFRPLRLDQLWNMFAPYPSRADGWTVFPGELEDGSRIDVLHPDQPLSWDKPEQALSQRHENIRWHTYRWRIWEKNYAAHREYYGRYLCREHNRQATPGKRLLGFEMIWMQEFSKPPGEPTSITRFNGWKHECITAELREKLEALRAQDDAAGAE